MAVKSSVDVKVPRVKVETTQEQAPAPEESLVQNQTPVQNQAPAKKTTASAPKPRVDVAVAKDTASASKPAPAAKPEPEQKPATTKKSASKPKVTMTVEPQVQESPVEAPQPTPPAQPALPTQPTAAANAQNSSEPSNSNAETVPPKVPSGQRIKEARRSVSGWVHGTFPGHEHAFWGGMLALLLSIMVFIIGPLRVLLICLLMFVGVAVGQVLDGDPKIIRTIQGLFDSDRDRA